MGVELLGARPILNVTSGVKTGSDIRVKPLRTSLFCARSDIVFQSNAEEILPSETALSCYLCYWIASKHSGSESWFDFHSSIVLISRRGNTDFGRQAEPCVGLLPCNLNLNSWFMETWCCLTMSQTIGPSESILSTLTGSSSPGSQNEVFDIICYLVLLRWIFWGLKLGPLAGKADLQPLNHSSSYTPELVSRETQVNVNVAHFSDQSKCTVK